MRILFSLKITSLNSSRSFLGIIPWFFHSFTQATSPLFFNLSDRSLVFGSNLISVADLSGYKQIDDKEIGNFFNYGVIKSPNTIYKNIYKLKPAEIITFNLEKNLQAQNHIYWSPTDEVDEKTFIDDEFYELFSSSINYRLESDFPVANFLSGGIDSALVLAIIYLSKRPDQMSWGNHASTLSDIT